MQGRRWIMSDYFFEIIIIVLFLYEGFVMITQKNGGHKRNLEKYTEESLAKYSKVAGVVFLVFAAYEVFILLNKMGVINVLSSVEDSIVRVLITTAPILIVIVVILVLHFTILKKNDGYVGSSAKNKNGNEDEEEY